MEKHLQRLGDSESPSYRPSLVGRFFLKALSGSMRVKAPKMFNPVSGEGDRAVLDRFLEQQAQFRALIKQTGGKDINRGKFPSPATALIRLTLGDGLFMMVTHQERHMAQIKRLQGMPQFPR